jgi:hypothetical protein
MIRTPSINIGAFVVSPLIHQSQSGMLVTTRVLLLFSASAMTDTGSKFVCSYQPGKHMMILKMVITCVIHVIAIIAIIIGIKILL